MSEHTKEPWHTRRLPHDVWAENGRHICDCQLLLVEDARQESEANARRIVACVNACQRLNTDLLERVTSNGGFGIHPRPQERIEELEQQRDELLTALSELVELKDLKDRIDTADLCTYDFDDAEAAQSLDDDYSRRKPLAWDAARAAIANVKDKA